MPSIPLAQRSLRDSLSLWYLAFIPLTVCLLLEFIPHFFGVPSPKNAMPKVKVEAQIDLPSTPTANISRVLTSRVGYSFYGAAVSLNLKPDVIQELTSLSSGKFDFIHSVASNGTFSVKLDNNQRLRAFLYQDSRKTYYIYHNNNTTLYSQDGKRFYKDKLLLSPVSRQFRISSAFNPSRRHPITQKVTGHLGTDYAVPISTPVVTISSGEILASRYHPLAGHYIVVAHPNGLKTRYLHLSKRFVSKGESVMQGQSLGLSGNSGRTTGPHLHFELWKDGRPIDFEKKRAFAEKVAVAAISSQTVQAKKTFATLKSSLN
ncbi:peptidoglycan DD-metalloendopeptidase family protein [Vibrio ostreicida]|uniref:Peptidoglycan DD-metalloendopeptidase family protein n=1 Tax=Vibrio ostreicida TaxID=526588 RepID=A0ABT8BX63_9VIBR|nr:peptidoglycan DD-metalloendopeptidase family protein [Vibrio ostreicida]MDN3611792.1 peptidoglycan DD-metalloendopeptidase family protein [Vibrio ostreicida]NPD09608.1 peptidoglycan DD-metalloendopeptidase family protein [Vibrio ostreicida]